MSTLATPVRTNVTAPLSQVASVRQDEKAAAGTAESDVTMITVAMAVLAILGLVTAFAALAGSALVVVALSLVSVVVSVATAFRELRRAGL